MENSSPNPSFSICDIRIQKQMSRSFAKSFPQKIVFAKLRPHCSATCPRPCGQNTKEKCPFLFQEKFHPRQIKKARNIFLWCCRVKRGSGGTIHSISGFCWKKVRILFRRHSKERERRSALRHKARVQVECVPQQANEGEVQRPSVSEEVLKHSSAYVCPALASAGARSKLKAQSRGQLRNVGDEILNLAK